MNHKPTQLSLNVFLEDTLTFDNFIAESESSTIACSHLRSLVETMNGDNLMLWGRRSSGLSHLLQALCHYAGLASRTSQYLPLKEFKAYPPEHVLSDLHQVQFLCIDDIDACAGDHAWESQLFHLFNQMKALGNSFICASHSSPQALAIALPDLKSRLMSSATFHIDELSDSAKVSALMRRAESMAMELPDEVAVYLLSRVSRDAKDLFQALQTLDKASLSQHRKLTVPFVKQELAL